MAKSEFPQFADALIVTGYIVWKYMSYYCANMNLWHSTYIIISIVANNHITIIMGGATIILLLCNDPKQGHLPTITSQNPICTTPHFDGL